MNLAEMMGAMKGDESPGLTDEQQITRLEEYFAQVFATEPERFEPGQIIWHKNPQLSDKRSADQPHIFLGYLDEPIKALDHVEGVRALFSPASTDVLDARIGCLPGSTGTTFCTYFLDSRYFTATKPS